MISVSSYRPLADSEEIARNQIRAKQSWDQAFSGIIYFGESDPRLSSDKTRFIPVAGFPTIILLVAAAMYADEPSCIINADIVVASHIEPMTNNAFRSGMKALTSRRWQFEPGMGIENAKIVDSGVDFFAASPDVWRKCYQDIPSEWRIGHGGWDSWMLGWMTHACKNRFGDLSHKRLIFHPRHGDREHRTHRIDVAPDRFAQHGFPVSVP